MSGEREKLVELITRQVLAALQHDDWSDWVSGWLEEADALPPGLDAERIKGLVFDPATRQIAFSLLGNPKIVPVKFGAGEIAAFKKHGGLP